MGPQLKSLPRNLLSEIFYLIFQVRPQSVIRKFFANLKKKGEKD